MKLFDVVPEGSEEIDEKEADQSFYRLERGQVSMEDVTRAKANVTRVMQHINLLNRGEICRTIY